MKYIRHCLFVLNTTKTTIPSGEERCITSNVLNELITSLSRMVTIYNKGTRNNVYRHFWSLVILRFMYMVHYFNSEFFIFT